MHPSTTNMSPCEKDIAAINAAYQWLTDTAPIVQRATPGNPATITIDDFRKLKNVENQRPTDLVSTGMAILDKASAPILFPSGILTPESFSAFEAAKEDACIPAPNRP